MLVGGGRWRSVEVVGGRSVEKKGQFERSGGSSGGASGEIVVEWKWRRGSDGYIGGGRWW